MVIRLIDLVKAIPFETEQIVERTKNRFNQGIREVLRRETGLRLSSQDRGDRLEEKEIGAVRIYLKPGVPAELENITFEADKWLAVILAPWKASLENLRLDASLVADKLCPKLMEREAVKRQYGESLDSFKTTAGLAEALLKEIEKFDLVREILAVRRDILGQYSYHLTRQPAMFGNERPAARIDLFWGIIGLVAKALAVTIEGLTFKVLAHELAHGYTHLGSDIDGHRWRSQDFERTEEALKEGLAQYYAVRVIERLNQQVPSAREAYEKLLEKQPAEYRTHVLWKDRKFSPEEIRLAMIETRRNGIGNATTFYQALKEAKERLRR